MVEDVPRAAGQTGARIDPTDYHERPLTALVVRERTGSDLAMAATFAASLLPSILGRSLLSPLADRLPSKHVLVGSDVVRAVFGGA